MIAFLPASSLVVSLVLTQYLPSFVFVGSEKEENERFHPLNFRVIS